RPREQRQQHAETVLAPVEGLPVLRADQNRQERIRVVQAMQATEVDRAGGESTRDHDQGPGAPATLRSITRGKVRQSRGCLSAPTDHRQLDKLAASRFVRYRRRDDDGREG